MERGTHTLSILQGRIYPCEWVKKKKAALVETTSQCLTGAWAEHWWLLHPPTVCFIVKANTSILWPSHAHCADGWGLALQSSPKNSFILQVLLLEIPQDFFLLPCEKPSASSLETTTFLVTPHIHTQLLLHYSWHREGMRTGDGKISACFLLLTQKLEKNKQQQQTAQLYNAGIQLCGSHGGFPRQAITLTVYIASQKQLEKL